MKRLYRIVDPYGSLGEPERKNLLVALALLIPFPFAPIIAALLRQVDLISIFLFALGPIAGAFVFQVNQRVSQNHRFWSHPGPGEWFVMGIVGAVGAMLFANSRLSTPAGFEFVMCCWVYIVAAEALSISSYVDTAARRAAAGLPGVNLSSALPPKNAALARFVGLFDPQFAFPQPLRGWMMLMPLALLVFAATTKFSLFNMERTDIFVFGNLWYCGVMIAFTLSQLKLFGMGKQPRPPKRISALILSSMAACLVGAVLVGIVSHSVSTAVGAFFLFVAPLFVLISRARSEMLASQTATHGPAVSPII